MHIRKKSPKTNVFGAYRDPTLEERSIVPSPIRTVPSAPE